MPFDAAAIDPLPPREEGAVRAIVLYDPLNPNDRTVADLAWGADKTLANYLDGLPEEGNWIVSAAGRLVEREEWATTALTVDDTIIVALAPQKGAGQILAIVAMIALAVAAPHIGAAAATAMGFKSFSWVATAIAVAATVAGGMVVNALLPAEKPKFGGGNDETSPSYGLDGPKSTAREDAPVPVAYGEFRIGGNRTNYYAQTSPDGLTQDLFLQYAVCDGEVDAISDILVNDQPITNFQDVEVQTGLGDPGQAPSPWFASTITPYSNGATITETPIVYDTQDAVDRVRLDVTFPGGLFNLDRKTGNRSPRSVVLLATATRLVDEAPAGPAVPFGVMSWSPVEAPSGTLPAGTSRARFTVGVVGSSGFGAMSSYAAEINVSQAGTTRLSRTEAGAMPNEYAGDDNWVPGEKLFVYEVDLDPAIATSVSVTGGTIRSVETYRALARITRNERTPLRFSLDSGTLEHGRYRIQITRANAETTNDYEQDHCVLSEVNEILAEPIALRRTAWYGIRVRLTEQLNSEPSTTALVRGRKVWIYDANGVKTDFRWSNNPADVALDVLLSENWQRPFLPSRIDFPWFARWRGHCTANGLTFNGVIDFRTTVWDALTTVMRTGRASPLVSGTRWSGVIEGPREPTMMFGTQNMIRESFENFWLGRAGRANHIEVQYYDRNDAYRRNSVYAVDDDALSRGEPIVQATINLIGVNDRAQAQAEADLQLRLNMGVTQGCRFRSNIEAIGCVVGDVIYAQHDLTRWGWADRVRAVAHPAVTLHRMLDAPGNANPGLAAYESMADESGAVLEAEDDVSPADGVGDFMIAEEIGDNLPSPQPMPEGDWRILVLKPARLMAVWTVVDVSGSRIVINDGVSTPIHRLVINGADYQVIDQTTFSSETAFRLDRSPVGAVGLPVQLWRTDEMLEGSIARPNVNDTTVTVTDWPHSLIIEAGDEVMIGRVGHYKKPFSVVRIGHDSDQIRTIECIEYNPWVYDPHTTPPPANYSELPTSPLHVLDLSALQENENVQGGGVRHWAVAIWSRPLNDLRGHAGSKVWVSRGDGPFILHETVTDGRQQSRVEAAVGETIRFRVVAMDRDGFLAPVATAPLAAVTIGLRARTPDAPTALAAQGGTRLISLTWQIPLDADIREIEIWESATDSRASAVLIESAYRRVFTRTGLNPAVTRYYWIRSVSYAGAVSDWVGPASATTTLLVADDLDNGILNTAKFAADIEPVTLVSSVPVSKITEVVFNTTNSKLYRWNGTAYTAAIPALDIDGVVPVANLPVDQLGLPSVDVLPGGLGSTDEGRTVYLTTDGKLYRWTGTEWTASVTAASLEGELGPGNFPTDLRPIERVIALPSVGNFQGRVVFLTTDQKLYRWTHASVTTGTTHWTTATATVDLSGQVTDAQIAALATAKLTGQITTTQITDTAISTAKLAAGAVVADKIAAGSIIASKLAIADTTNLITNPIFTLDNGVTGSTDGWTVSSGVVSLTRTDALVPAGAPAPFVLSQPIATGVRDANWGITTSQIAVTPGETFAFDFWATCAPDTNANLLFRLYAYGVSNVVAISTLQSVTTAVGVAGWARYTGHIVIPPVAGDGEQTVRMALQFRAQANASPLGRWLVTQVKVRRSGNAEMIVDGAITATKIAAGAVVADKIQAGAVVADKIAANAVLASKVAIGDTTNLYPDPQMLDPAFYANSLGGGYSLSSSGTTAVAGQQRLQLVSSGDIQAVVTGWFEVQPSTDYLALVGMWTTSSGTGTGTVEVEWASTSGATATPLSPRSTVVSQQDGNTTVPFSAVMVSPATARRARFVFTRAAGTGLVYNFGRPELRRRNGGQLIVDGSITATKIATDAVTADKILAGEVTAAKIATGAVTADKIDANAVTAVKIQAGAVETDKLAANAVTADKIEANSIIAGKIAAGAISSAQIAAGEIKAVNLASETLITSAAQLGAAVVGTAQIGDLQVNSAKIANLTVGNSKVTGNAITTLSNANTVPSLGVGAYRPGIGHNHHQLLSVIVTLRGDGRALVLVGSYGVQVNGSSWSGGGDGFGGSDGES